MKTALVNKAKSETKQCSLNCVGYLPNLQTHNINLDDDRCIFFKRLKLKPNKQKISDKKVKTNKVLVYFKIYTTQQQLVDKSC